MIFHDLKLAKLINVALKDLGYLISDVFVRPPIEDEIAVPHVLFHDGLEKEFDRLTFQRGRPNAISVDHADIVTQRASPT